MPMFGKGNIEIEINKDAHLLVLDQKWHALFKDKKPGNVNRLEKELNNLLQKQGKYTTELKEYTDLKKKMMDEIVAGMKNAYDDKDKAAIKKMEQNKKYIDQINKKLEHHQKELTVLPEKISETNKKLVNATMNCFYHTMTERKVKSEKLDLEVEELKNKISEAILQRDEAKEHYQQLYGYIHDVVGPDIIEQYDRYYSKD